MKPVEQTILHDPDKGVVGNCFAACLASLLEISLEDVPHFVETSPDAWQKDLNQWLAARGLAFVDVWCPNPTNFQWYVTEQLGHVGFYILSGPSPRHKDVDHAVIAKGGEIVFDPHPSKAGIADGYRWIGLLVNRCGAPMIADCAERCGGVA